MHDDDVNVTGIAIFMGILAATVVIFYFVVTAMWHGLEQKASRADQKAMSQTHATSPSQLYFPFPREQPDPLADLNALRARDDAELTNYGWINKTSGIVRIPIDRAIDLLVERSSKGNP